VSDDESVAYAVQVRLHVWDSLVSMLRVYAHAASLNGKEYVVTSTHKEAWVKHQDSTLDLRFDSDTGEGCWRITHPEREAWGEFRIEEDGTLTLPVGPKPLDQAAIDWVERLGHSTVNPPAAEGYGLQSQGRNQKRPALEDV
jgi:hypothetical protein